MILETVHMNASIDVFYSNRYKHTVISYKQTINILFPFSFKVGQIETN